MREIKFRAWDNKNKKWIVYFRILPNGQVEVGKSDGNRWRYKKEDVDLIQYTGLKDKNGKEIYEGDIAVVRNLHDGDEYVWDNENQKPIPFEITWDKTGFYFGNSCMSYRSYDYEIIGNIYENPELKTKTPTQ